MKTIFLIGYMGSGKTTLGTVLSEELNCRFIDLDDFIEAKHNSTIRNLFERFGEERFRQMEHEALLEVAHMPSVVVACGGGTPCYHNNMSTMNDLGITVFLTTSEECLLARLTLPEAKAKRPLIANKTAQEVRQYIHQALTARLPFYSQAAITFDSTDIETAETNAATAKVLAQLLRSSFGD